MVGTKKKIYTKFCRVIARDEGVTFMEAIVTFVMLMAAAVVVIQSLSFGNRMLDVDMHKQQALRVVQCELEYWTGRLYLQASISPDVLSPKNNYKSVELDMGDDWMGPPIVLKLSRSSIVPINDPTQSGSGEEAFVAYYALTIWAEWEEPDGQNFSKSRGNEVALTTYISTNQLLL